MDIRRKVESVASIGVAASLILGLGSVLWLTEAWASIDLASAGEIGFITEWWFSLEIPLLLLGNLAALASFVWWHWEAHSLLKPLGRQGVKHQDTATFGWWFVPFANLFMPFVVTAETVRGSTATTDDEHWRRLPLPQSVAGWTGFFLVGLGGYSAVSRVANNALDLDTLLTAVRWSGVFAVVTAVAGLAAIILISEVSTGQKRLALDSEESMQAASTRTPLTISKEIQGSDSDVATKTTSRVELRQLSKHRDWIVRKFVAANPRSPDDVLASLGKDKYTGVRVAAGRNPSTPRSTLERLIESDLESSVVLAASETINKQLPESLGQTEQGHDDGIPQLSQVEEEEGVSADSSSVGTDDSLSTRSKAAVKPIDAAEKVISSLERLSRLKEEGHLSDQEFASLKAALIAGNGH